jgi:hypothetical protein
MTRTGRLAPVTLSWQTWAVVAVVLVLVLAAAAYLLLGF